MTELVARLDRIFQNLFGCRLEFTDARNLLPNEWDLRALENDREESAETPSYIEDLNARRIGFPIRQGRRLLGLAIISDGQLIRSKPKQLFDLAELSTSLLEHEFASEAEGPGTPTLKRLEEQLLVQRGGPNVIPLRGLRAKPAPSPWAAWMPETTAEPRTLSSLLVEVKKGFPLHPLALELHSSSERLSLISIHDLPHDTFSSLDGIKSLGAITVFIPEIGELSLERQAEIASYLSTSPSSDMPVFIAGTTVPSDQLEADGRLLFKLKSLLSRIRLPWNPQDRDAITVKKCIRLIDGFSRTGRMPIPAETRFVPFHASLLDDQDPTLH